MNKVNDILIQFKNLNSKELKQISEKLLQMLQGASGEAFFSHKEVDKCSKCDSGNFIKFGKDKNGKQRYKCKNCGATFTATSFSVVSKTHYDYNTWETYIEELLRQSSLAECAKKCNISVQTAFVWRHKILKAILKDQDNRVMAGIIEVDETYVSINYKGNHKKSKRFKLPRPAYRRGVDNRVRKESKACVMCAVERNGQVYGEAVGRGQPTITMLKHSFKERLLPDSLIISDKSRGLRNYFNNYTSLELIQLLAKQERNKRRSPPEIKGIYHIQTVNALHNRFRKFLRAYNGVSTKYLNHYVNLFIWIEKHKHIADVDMNEELRVFLEENNSYIKAEDIFSYPPTPTVA